MPRAMHLRHRLGAAVDKVQKLKSVRTVGNIRNPIQILKTVNFYSIV